MDINTDQSQEFEEAIKREASNKNKNLKWDKLPKYTQWKVFKAYMHENKLTNDVLFKKMKSLISEKRTEPIVTYDVNQQKITSVDFKHEVFIRERSKKKKLKVQKEQAMEEEKIKDLEASILGINLTDDLIEVVQEEHCVIEDVL